MADGVVMTVRQWFRLDRRAQWEKHGYQAELHKLIDAALDGSYVCSSVWELPHRGVMLVFDLAAYEKYISVYESYRSLTAKWKYLSGITE